MIVIVYSQPDCPPCEWTKEFLIRNGIAHTVKDVQADPHARKELMAMGYRSTPVTVIDGIPVAGFDQRRLLELLASGKCKEGGV